MRATWTILKQWLTWRPFRPYTIPVVMTIKVETLPAISTEQLTVVNFTDLTLVKIT